MFDPLLTSLFTFQRPCTFPHFNTSLFRIRSSLKYETWLNKCPAYKKQETRNFHPKFGSSLKFKLYIEGGSSQLKPDFDRIYHYKNLLLLDLWFSTHTKIGGY